MKSFPYLIGNFCIKLIVHIIAAYIFVWVINLIPDKNFPMREGIKFTILIAVLFPSVIFIFYLIKDKSIKKAIREVDGVINLPRYKEMINNAQNFFVDAIVVMIFYLLLLKFGYGHLFTSICVAPFAFFLLRKTFLHFKKVNLS